MRQAVDRDPRSANCREQQQRPYRAHAFRMPRRTSGKRTRAAQRPPAPRNRSPRIHPDWRVPAARSPEHSRNAELVEHIHIARSLNPRTGGRAPSTAPPPARVQPPARGSRSEPSRAATGSDVPLAGRTAASPARKTRGRCHSLTLRAWPARTARRGTCPACSSAACSPRSGNYARDSDRSGVRQMRVQRMYLYRCAPMLCECFDAVQKAA